MSYEVPCALCGEPVDVQDRYTQQRITGWQKMAGLRASGKHGGSDITLRETVDEWAHTKCVDLKRSGLLGQKAFV